MSILKSLPKVTFSPRLIYLCCLLALLGTWQIGQNINTRLSRLPVQQAPKVNHSGAGVDAKSIYPVWVKQAVAKAEPLINQGSLDTFFRQSRPVKVESDAAPVTNPEPDYIGILTKNTIITGVADNGAFLNGGFIQLGKPWLSMPIVRPGSSTVFPVLQRVGLKSITLQVADRSIELKIKD